MGSTFSHACGACGSSLAPGTFLCGSCLECMQRPPARTQLVTISQTQLRRYNFVTLSWQCLPLRSPARVAFNSSWVALEDCVFCCGGSPDGSERYIVGTRYTCLIGYSGSVAELAPMGSARLMHGVVAVLLDVYVFGGCKAHTDDRGGTLHLEGLKTCEKYAQKAGAWRPLAAMHSARLAFNACVWGQFIYVCGEGSSGMEAFDLQTQRFLLLPVQCEYSPSCLCVIGDQMVVLSNRSMRKYRAGRRGQLVLESEVQLQEIDKRQNTQPVVADGRVYLTYKGEVSSYSLETGDIS